MSAKTAKHGVLWNVNENRLESLHQSEDEAKEAAVKFLAKSGENADLTDLDTAEFSVRLRQAPEPPKEEKKDK
jgi:hypothetical protein